MRTEDGYIIQQCLDGDKAAFGLLVDKYRRSIYALAYSKVRNFHDAQDITQEVFIKAYRNLRLLRRWDNFMGWLYRITCNLCIDWLRSNSKRPDREFIEDQEAGAVEHPAVDLYRENMVYQSIREALDSLPEMYRQVLTLRYFGGMTIKEMSRFLGVSPATIKRQLRRARGQLKEEMPAMISTTYEQHQLPPNSTFRIVELVKRIRFQPSSRPTGTSLGLSLAAAVVITVLSLNLHPGILGHIAIPADQLPSVEAKALETGEIPVEMLTLSEMLTIPNWQAGGSDGFQGPDLQSTPTSVVESQEGYAPDQQHVNGIQSDSDLAEIRRLFLTLERGYEEHDIEKYMSVFSNEEYEYTGDMATSDDPTDDVHYLGVEKERSSAERVFGAYEILDMELTECEIIIDGDSAEVRNDIKILILVSEEPAFPRILCATTSNIYFVKKCRGEWKIVRWESHETPSDELDARRRKKIEDKGVEVLIRDLGSDDKAIWGMAIVDLIGIREENIAHLINALHHPNRNVRHRIILILSGTRNYDAVGALADILGAEENDADIRVAAAKALFDPTARIYPSHPVLDRALFVAARSSDPEIRSATCLLLALRFSWRMDRFLEYAIESGWSKDEAETIHAEMIKSLMESIGSPNPNLRRQAAISLGHVKHQPALKPLARMLLDKDEDGSVRMQAIMSISVIDQNKAFDPIVLITKDKSETDSLRSVAGHMLAKYKDSRSVPLFLYVLADKMEPPRLRQTAIRHLRTVSHLESVYHSEAFIQALENAVDDGDKEISTTAQKALSDIEARLADDLR